MLSILLLVTLSSCIIIDLHPKTISVSNASSKPVSIWSSYIGDEGYEIGAYQTRTFSIPSYCDSLTIFADGYYFLSYSAKFDTDDSYTTISLEPNVGVIQVTNGTYQTLRFI